MSLFTAEQIGALSDGATFGNTSPGTKGVDWPGETDDVDVAGYALTQGTATGVGSLTDLVTGGGTLTLTGSFACPDVQEVRIIVPNGVTSTISFGTSGVDPGCQYSGSVSPIECQVGGTVTDVTGDLEISGEGGVLSAGTVTDFSGTLNYSGGGYGAYNDAGTWGDFSGVLNNSSAGTGAYNANGTWTDFSGVLNNTGGGIAVWNNNGDWLEFSGTCLDSGSGVAFKVVGGTIGNITGIIGRPSSQADLAAENIVDGKTILGVEGTWTWPQTTTLAVALRAAVGMSAANLDSQLGALPTAEENATAVETAVKALKVGGRWPIQ